MKHIRSFLSVNILTFIALLVFGGSNVISVKAQCQTGYPIDCGNGYCCPSDYPVCGTGANVGKCGTDGGGCPADYPIDCGNGYCCPSTHPICGTGENVGKCSDQPLNTTTISGQTTTTVPGGDTTTTVPGGGTTGDFLTAININGNEEPDAPQSSGALPGTSPSKINVYQSNMHSNKQKYYAVDRIFPPLDPYLIEKYKPKLFEELKAQEGSKITFTEGEQKSLWVKDDKDLVWRQVSATNKKSGVHCDIFIDDTINISSDVIEFYKKEFDEVMFDTVSSNFGSFVDKDNSGKLSILIYGMNEDTSSGVYTCGYF